MVVERILRNTAASRHDVIVVGEAVYIYVYVFIRAGPVAKAVKAAVGRDLQISTSFRAGTVVSPICKQAPSARVVLATSSTSRSEPVMVKACWVV